MKELAIFDFDGTLVDSVEDVIISFNKALEIHNFPTLTREEYLDRLGGNIDEIISLILKDNSSAENIELVKATYLKLYYASQNNHTVPFPNVHGLLELLQARGILLAINSNRKNDSLNGYVEKFFSDIHFVAVEGHNQDYPSKPSQFAVNMIMEKCNLNKDDCIYIGDSITDIRTAQNAGIECLLVRWGYGRKDAFENDYPTEIIGNASEILKYF